MSDNDNILGSDSRTRLAGDITLLMLKGGGYALVFCLITVFTILIIAAIGRTLPEESREQPDPINRGSLELIQPIPVQIG